MYLQLIEDHSQDWDGIIHSSTKLKLFDQLFQRKYDLTLSAYLSLITSGLNPVLSM